MEMQFHRTPLHGCTVSCFFRHCSLSYQDRFAGDQGIVESLRRQFVRHIRFQEKCVCACVLAAFPVIHAGGHDHRDMPSADCPLGQQPAAVESR